MAFSLAKSTRLITRARPAAFNLAMRTYAEAAPTLNLTFGTPRQAFFDNVAVNQVDVPSTTGYFGLLANHVPTIAAMKPGKLTVYSEEGTAHHFIVSSGTVTVNNDSSCQILAEEAAPIENFDLASAKSALDSANAAMSSAGSEEAKAAAQVEVEALQGIIDALA